MSSSGLPTSTASASTTAILIAGVRTAVVTATLFIAVRDVICESTDAVIAAGVGIADVFAAVSVIVGAHDKRWRDENDHTVSQRLCRWYCQSLSLLLVLLLPF
jgi:hypothetical protein